MKKDNRKQIGIQVWKGGDVLLSLYFEGLMSFVKCEDQRRNKETLKRQKNSSFNLTEGINKILLDGTREKKNKKKRPAKTPYPLPNDILFSLFCIYFY